MRTRICLLLLLAACQFVSEGTYSSEPPETKGVRGRCGEAFECRSPQDDTESGGDDAESDPSSDEAGDTESSSGPGGSDVSSSGGESGSSSGAELDPYGPCDQGCWPDVLTDLNDGCVCAPQCTVDEDCPDGGVCGPGWCYVPCAEDEDCPAGMSCEATQFSGKIGLSCSWPN